MKQFNRTSLAVLAVGGVALTLAVSGCKEDGPATKAGKAVDNSVEKAGEATGDALNTAGDAVKDATKNP
ncbi:MAG: hypothetical protein JNK53_07680 [Phycisphaerae bacterium]|nr:hypothetical protein [Phycisphaerae bacterium]